MRNLKAFRDKSADSPASFIDEASSGPLSPSYSFVLPPNSPLAESVAAEARAVSTPPKQKHSALLSSLDRVPRRSTPLFTRSAEPSPTYSTFSGLDQSQPPPEFVPRLSAQEFSAKSSRIAQSTKARHARTQSDADSPDLVSPIEAVFPTANTRLPSRLPNRQAQRLPSLQQIQAKMTGGHRRTGSAGSMPAMEKQTTELRLDVTMVSASGSSIIATQPRPCGTRTDSEDSLEVIRTPDDEMPSPLRERRLALQAIMNRRPPTPPSPSGGKERLLPFLRERTSDRLASVKKEMVEQATGQSIPCTPPNASTTTSRPVLRVTPPSFESRPAVPPLVLAPKAVLAARSSSGSGFFNARSRHVSSPTELRFTPPARLSTPPARAFSGSYSHTQAYGSGSGPGTPISPATSVRSLAPSCSSGSPTMNMPIITCTPAPPVVLRDGVEQDSDDGSEPDVIVFDGEAEEREREERERRGSEMRAKLGLRRRSID